MEELKTLYKNKQITQMDMVVYLSLDGGQVLTAKQISFRLGFDYSQTTISLNRLIDASILKKTNDTPSKYFT
jgi:hypothetical protein